MTNPGQPRVTRKKRVREYNARGSIYAWLRAHHGDVVRCRDVEKRPWAVLVSEMISDGIRREDGLEPTVKNVSRVWERVCRDVAAEAAAAKPKRRVPPSRISPDWRPTVVPQRPVAPAPQASLTRAVVPAHQAVLAPQPASTSRAVLPSGGKSLVDPNDHPLVQAQMARLDVIFEDIENKRLPRG
jgi:hypothetical protein